MRLACQNISNVTSGSGRSKRVLEECKNISISDLEYLSKICFFTLHFIELNIFLQFLVF